MLRLCLNGINGTHNQKMHRGKTIPVIEHNRWSEMIAHTITLKNKKTLIECLYIIPVTLPAYIAFSDEEKCFL